MTQEIRRSAHLEALARLQPRWDHDVNDEFGGVKIQIDVLIAMVAAERGSTIDLAKLTSALDRSSNAIRKFQTAFATQFAIRRGDPYQQDEFFDVGAHVARLGPVLGASARLQLKASCTITTPDNPVWIEGGEPELREAVTIAAVEMLFLAREGESVAIRLGVDGERAALRIEGPRRPADSTPWLTAVRETLVKFGGRLETGNQLGLDLIIPMAAVPR